LEQEHGLKTSHKTVHGLFKWVVSRDKLPLGWAEPEQPLRPPRATDVNAKNETIPDQSPINHQHYPRRKTTGVF
jgi:hypothetical protein